MNISETSLMSSSTIASSTVSIVNPSLGFPIEVTSSLVTSIATSTTNEKIPKLEMRYNKGRDWTNAISLLYGKTFKQSMMDK